MFSGEGSWTCSRPEGFRFTMAFCGVMTVHLSHLYGWSVPAGLKMLGLGLCLSSPRFPGKHMPSAHWKRLRIKCGFPDVQTRRRRL